MKNNKKTMSIHDYNKKIDKIIASGKPDNGNLLIIDGDTKEVISYTGFNPPIIKSGKIIKNGELLNVKRI